MKPLKLQFKGINSFSEETAIDFEKLTKSGIFGIFGDTGSGKSTILDCINFALYGKVERSKEKLDIINYRSDVAEVKFEFNVVTEGKRKTYSVERSLKKKSGLHKAALYEDGQCIADNATTVTKKITDILGVDAEDFRKCIALPQGEFSQFVKSQQSERISLIERLFSLSKYGDRLKERLKLRENQAEMSYQTVCAKLGLYNSVSEEMLKDCEKQISLIQQQTERLAKDSEAAEKEYARLKTLYEKSEELCSLNKSWGELQSKKTQMEELRNNLKCAPICKSAVQTDDKVNELSKTLLKLEERLKNIGKGLENAKVETERLNQCINKGNFDEQITDCITLSAKYSACEGKPEKLALIQKRLDQKRGEYKQKEELSARLKIKLSEAENSLKSVEAKLSEIGSSDFEQLINVWFKGAILKDEYVNSLDYFVGLNGQVKFYKGDSELYKFISRELKQRIDIYKDRVYQVKDFKLSEAQQRLKNLQTAIEHKDLLSAELNERKAALKDAQTAVNECKRDIEIILKDGEELRNRYEEIKGELVKVFGGAEDYLSKIRQNEQKLCNLKKQKEQLLSDIERYNKQTADLTAEQYSCITEIKSIKSEISLLKEKLKELISQSGLQSIESCKKLASGFDKFADAEKALSEYDSELISVSSRRKQLENIKDLNSFSVETLKASEERKKQINYQLTSERERLAVMQSDYKNNASRLNEKKQLLKELAEAEKQRNLIAGLKDLTKGNKFMEFIANEYLYDISSLASTTLLNLTDGRYFLTYTDNFYAGDNFNCGKLRGVNTLSGGETFLVSLSLALALSQTICASLKSIEFFFLDEGFGTLDGTLVDTVLNALEKLKGSHFTIGVISHVEELKHRIDNKITVYKATENHGSTVQISC